MRIGVLGVGALTEAIVTGVQKSKSPYSWCLSPRSAFRVERLLSLPQVSVAQDNQSVVDQCSTVIIGVRPDDLQPLATQIKLTSGHHLLCLAAGVHLETLQKMFYPAKVTRMMASIAAEYPGASVFFFPKDAQLSTCFSSAGFGVQSFTTELQFEASMLSVCVNAWWLDQVHALAQTFADETGMPLAEAVELLARAQQESVTLLKERRQTTPTVLAREIGTPGTFTARGLYHLKERQAEKPWVDILSQLLKELKSKE